jgi:hypothetical protein
MKPAAVENWAWVLIYAGLLVLSLGVFVLQLGGVWGWALVVPGLLLAVGGGVLIYLRSRMDDKP